jgi:hypothetical protein
VTLLNLIVEVVATAVAVVADPPVILPLPSTVAVNVNWLLLRVVVAPALVVTVTTR